MQEFMNEDKQPQLEEMPENKESGEGSVKDLGEKQKIMDILREGEEKEASMDRAEDEYRKKWEQKIKALESIQPTGNILEDSKAFIEAAEIDPEKLSSPYREAFKNEDPEGIMQYFRDLERSRNAENLPPSMKEYALRYFKEFDQAVNRIISAAKLAEKKKN